MADQTAQKLCFVIGPIGADGSKERIHSSWVLSYIIRPVMAGFPDYRVKWALEEDRPGLIDAQLINDLLTADLVIADMSTSNPNAFYEIGIRHMAQKPIIHMQLADEKIPFDQTMYRSIKFSLLTPDDIEKAKLALKGQVAATDVEGYQVENPVTKARGALQLKEHATAPEQVLLDQIDYMNRRLTRIEQSPLGLSIVRPQFGELDKLPIKFKFTADTFADIKFSFATSLFNAARNSVSLGTGTDDGVSVVVDHGHRQDVYELLQRYRKYIANADKIEAQLGYGRLAPELEM